MGPWLRTGELPLTSLALAMVAVLRVGLEPAPAAPAEEETMRLSTRDPFRQTSEAWLKREKKWGKSG